MILVGVRVRHSVDPTPALLHEGVSVMDLHIAVKWVEALRSGRYQQTAGSLHGPSLADPETKGFCCLGVLCDLHREFINGQMGMDAARWAGVLGYRCGEFSSKSVLPDNVRQWAGLESQNPSFIRRAPTATSDCSTYLSDMNDGGKSFEAIADAIEAVAATL